MNNEGNILSAVSSTRLETRVETASRCFAIIIRNNTFFHLFARSRSFPLLSERTLSLRPPSLSFLIPFHFAILSLFMQPPLLPSPLSSLFFSPLPFLSFLLRFTPLPCFLYRRQSVETSNNPLPPSGVWWILFRAKLPIEHTNLHSLARDERDIFNSETRHLLSKERCLLELFVTKFYRSCAYLSIAWDSLFHIFLQ